MVFRNYQDMAGVDRLNIQERQNVFRFIDNTNRPYASDQFTENAGFQINCRHFRSISLFAHSYNIINMPPRSAHSQMTALKDYAPVARHGRLLDYIDCFAPAHSLASLAPLEGELARL